MCWVSDANAPTPPNLSDMEGCNRPLTANDFRPPEPGDLLAELSQKSSVSEPGFSHHAQRTKAIPEGAGKRIRAVHVCSVGPVSTRHAVVCVFLAFMKITISPLSSSATARRRGSRYRTAEKSEY